MTRSYTPSQIGGGILAGEFTRGSAFVPLAEVEKRTRELNEARAEVERLREVIRTIRARCVELDDSDAVSEVLDISSTALGDEP